MANGGQTSKLNDILTSEQLEIALMQVPGLYLHTTRTYTRSAFSASYGCDNRANAPLHFYMLTYFASHGPDELSKYG